MTVRMVYDPLRWFGVGVVLKNETDWVLVEWPTAAGVQWVERGMLA